MIKPELHAYNNPNPGQLTYFVTDANSQIGLVLGEFYDRRMAELFIKAIEFQQMSL
jgi:hypothetical protein